MATIEAAHRTANRTRRHTRQVQQKKLSGEHCSQRSGLIGGWMFALNRRVADGQGRVRRGRRGRQVRVRSHTQARARTPASPVAGSPQVSGAHKEVPASAFRAEDERRTSRSRAALVFCCRQAGYLPREMRYSYKIGKPRIIWHGPFRKGRDTRTARNEQIVEASTHDLS